MSGRVTIGTLAVAGFAIFPEDNRRSSTIQEAPAPPLEIAFRGVQKNPCVASKLTIVLGRVFQVRQVVWGKVASHSRRIMMPAAWVSSPNWADPRLMPWSSADSARWRAWPIAAAWTPMAAAAMAPGCWSGFRKLSSERPLALTGLNCPDEFAVGMVFLQRGQEVQAIDAIRAAVAKFDLSFLGWRTVPTDPSILGPRSSDSLPVSAAMLHRASRQLPV